MKRVLLLSILSFLFPLFVHAQELRVSTIERKPFVFVQEQDFSGFSIDLWEAIAQDNGWSYTYVEASSFVDLLRSARESSTDLAIANITASTDRAELMDFSDPIFDSGLQIMTPKIERLTYLYESLSLAQSLLLLSTLCILVLILAHALWLVERTKSRSSYVYSKGITEAVRTLITLGRLGKNVPSTSVGKCILLLWMITMVSAIAIYVSSFTKTLTSLVAADKITSYEDLRGKSVGTTRGSTSQAFLRKNKIEADVYINPEQLFIAAALGEVDAVLHDSDLLKYFAANQGKGKVTILPKVYEKRYYAIALPPGSPLRDPINDSLTKLRLEGMYDDLYKKWFTQK